MNWAHRFGICPLCWNLSNIKFEMNSKGWVVLTGCIRALHSAPNLLGMFLTVGTWKVHVYIDIYISFVPSSHQLTYRIATSEKYG